MKKLFLAAVLALLASSSSAQTYYHQLSQTPSAMDVNSGTQGNASGGAATLFVSPPQTGPTGTLFNNSIPFLFASSGTMGNNGAITGLTTLPVAYPHAYVYVPAGAIATSSLAGWYHATCGSTTACTLTNDTYTSGQPTIPTSSTAFVTTGPGAYTQTTGADTLPGGYLAPNHCFNSRYLSSYGGATTNNKIVKIVYNTTTVATLTNATAANIAVKQNARTCDRGATAVQVTDQGAASGGGTIAPVFSTVADSANQAIKFSFQLATDTDFIAMEQESVEFVP